MNEKESRDKREKEVQEYHYQKNRYNLDIRPPKKTKQERKAKWTALARIKGSKSDGDTDETT